VPRSLLSEEPDQSKLGCFGRSCKRVKHF
jgi:hypothetical protein